MIGTFNVTHLVGGYASWGQLDIHPAISAHLKVNHFNTPKVEEATVTQPQPE